MVLISACEYDLDTNGLPESCTLSAELTHAKILKDLYEYVHTTLPDGISESRLRDTCNPTLSDINLCVVH